MNDLQNYKINVTSFLNRPDLKEVKQQIFETLINKKGRLEIIDGSVNLCFWSLFEKEKFRSDLQ